MTSPTPDNPLQFWQDALAGKKPPISEGEPHRGYYATREGGTRQPVQVYPSASGIGLVAYVGAKGAGRAVAAADIWTRIASHPIPFETWRAVYNGAPWPDEAAPAPDAARLALPPEEVKRLEADAASLTEDWRAKGEPPPDGHNRPYDGALSDLGDELDNLAEDAAKLLRHGVTGQADADRIANVKDKARALKKRLDEAYRVEWEPLDKAIKAVRARYQPAQNRAEAITTKLLAAVTRWMAAEDQRRREAAAAAIKAGTEEVKVEPVRVGGAAGSKTGLRKQPDTAEVQDWGVLFAALVDNPEMRALAQKLANKAASVGAAFAGTTIVKGGKKAV